MAQKQGVVQEIEEKTTQTGKRFHRVQVDDVWYSTWEGAPFKLGQTISFNEIVKGQFKNMAGAEVVSGGGQTGVSTQQPSGNSLLADSGRRSVDPEREQRIVRQNATSSAVALLAASKLAGKQDVDALLELVRATAKRLFDMNMHGYDWKGPAPLAGEKEVGADTLFAA